MGGALALLSFQREAFGLLLDVWRHSPPRTPTASLALTALATAIAHQSGLPEHRRELPGMLAPRPADRPWDTAVTTSTPSPPHPHGAPNPGPEACFPNSPDPVSWRPWRPMCRWASTPTPTPAWPAGRPSSSTDRSTDRVR
ncbi:hypothetical protein STANM309S_06557 [Streptomyces tanashiensis]